MATRLDGNVRKATANTVTSMARSADRRQCPECGRKSALVSDRQDWGDRIVIVTACRWKWQPTKTPCSYEVTRDV